MAEERLNRAMTETIIAAGSGDSQELKEKINKLESALRAADPETARQVIHGASGITVKEVLDVVLAFGGALREVAALITRIRG